MATIQIVNFKAAHAGQIDEQDATARLRGFMSEDNLKSVEENDRHAYTVLIDGRVVMCAGVREYWHGRGEAWALIDKRAGRHFTSIHRIAECFLGECDVRRVEAVVNADFSAGHRWARLLGFELEAPLMQSYLPTGESASLYSFVKSQGVN